MADRLRRWHGRGREIFRRWRAPMRIWWRRRTIRITKKAIGFEHYLNEEAFALRRRGRRADGGCFGEGGDEADGAGAGVCAHRSARVEEAAGEPEGEPARDRADCRNFG